MLDTRTGSTAEDPTTGPAALCFTPDGRTLYVADHYEGALRATTCKDGADGKEPAHWTSLSRLNYTAAALSANGKYDVRCIAMDAAAPHIVYVLTAHSVVCVDTRAQSAIPLAHQPPPSTFAQIWKI